MQAVSRGRHQGVVVGADGTAAALSKRMAENGRRHARNPGFIGKCYGQEVIADAQDRYAAGMSAGSECEEERRLRERAVCRVPRRIPAGRLWRGKSLAIAGPNNLPRYAGASHGQPDGSGRTRAARGRGALDPMQNKPNRRCVRLNGVDIAESQKQHCFG